LLLLPPLPSPATTAAAARPAKTRPEVARVLGGHSGEDPEKSPLRVSLVALWSMNQPRLHEAKIPIGVAASGYNE